MLANSTSISLLLTEEGTSGTPLESFSLCLTKQIIQTIRYTGEISQTSNPLSPRHKTTKTMCSKIHLGADVNEDGSVVEGVQDLGSGDLAGKAPEDTNLI